jgi:hypothetical protein
VVPPVLDAGDRQENGLGQVSKEEAAEGVMGNSMTLYA